MKHSIKLNLFVVIFAILILSSCAKPGNNDPGSEYMPDMAHSIAYEANLYNYYYNNTWDAQSVKDLKSLSIPGEPVSGTIPRGYAGVAMSKTGKAKTDVMNALSGASSTSAIAVPVNGSVPFYYANTEDERSRATTEMIQNPFPITAKGLEEGKELYDIFCGICHGKKGDGVGYLVADENTNAKYPAQPANLIQGDLLTASNGRYYFAIMHGKNVMGGYADKLSYEERWNVIHHIRSLQASATKTKYTAKVNTLNDIEIPGETLPPIASEMSHDMDHGHDEGHDDDGAHHGTEHHEGDHSHDGDHSHEGKDHSHEGDDHSHEGGDHK